MAKIAVHKDVANPVGFAAALSPVNNPVTLKV